MLKNNIREKGTCIIKNDHVNRCFILNEKNVNDVLFENKRRSENQQLLRYYKKGLNNWIELYNNDRFKNKKKKKRMNYYINKLNEFERLLND